MNHNTGWEGYDYILNRSRSSEKVSVEKFVNNSWSFENIGEADYAVKKNGIVIKVKKTLLGLTEENISFDFKWADNSTETGDVMQFMDLGDVAPDCRFNFRYMGDNI